MDKHVRLFCKEAQVFYFVDRLFLKSVKRLFPAFPSYQKKVKIAPLNESKAQGRVKAKASREIKEGWAAGVKEVITGLKPLKKSKPEGIEDESGRLRPQKKTVPKRYFAVRFFRFPLIAAVPLTSMMAKSDSTISAALLLLINRKSNYKRNRERIISRSGAHISCCCQY